MAPPGVGVLEARQRRAAGQRLLAVGGDVGQDLEQGIAAEFVGVVTVGVAGQQLVDLLGQETLGRVADEQRVAWVGQAGGQIGQDAQGAIQGADGHQAGVGDDRPLVEGNLQLLPAEVPQGKVSLLLVAHGLEPPQGSKLLAIHSLDTARGSPCLCTVRNPG